MIQIRDLTKIIDGTTLVRRMSFDIAEGDLFGILGPLGSGASTVVKIITTLIPPTSGKVSVNGHDIWAGQEQVRACIGYMPEVSGAYEYLRIGEFLEMYARAYHLREDDIQPGIARVLRDTEIDRKQRTQIAKLKPLERRQLAIARCLLHAPPVLILDDPARGLPPALRRRIKDIIRRVHQQGRTVVVCSKLLTDVLGLCNRVAVINRGELVAEGDLDALTPRLDRIRPIEALLAGDPQAALKWLHAQPEIPEAVAAGQTLTFLLAARFHDPLEFIGRLTRAGHKVEAWREYEVLLDGNFEPGTVDADTGIRPGGADSSWRSAGGGG